MSRPIIYTSVFLTSTIAVPGVIFISHIAFVKSGSLWAGECKVLKQVDFSGKVIQVINDAKSHRGDFTVTENGDLLYVQIGSKRVLKKLDIGAVSILDTADKEEILCIHSSRINGDLLVGIKSISTDTCKITRYDKTGNMIQDIELFKERRLYEDPSYITENMNRDIVTSDFLKKSVVVVDKSGEYRFDYSGRNKKIDFLPCGVCTDDRGYILVISCFEDNIHVLNQNGLFLNLVLGKHVHRIDWGLCVGDRHDIYIGNKFGEIKVFKSMATQITL